MHEPLKAVTLTAAAAGVLLAAPIGSIVAVRAATPVHVDDSAALPDAEHEIVDRHDDISCPHGRGRIHPRAVDHPDGTTGTVTWGTAGEDTIVIRPGNATAPPDGCWWGPDEAALRTAGDRPMTFVDVTRTE